MKSCKTIQSIWSLTISNYVCDDSSKRILTRPVRFFEHNSAWNEPNFIIDFAVDNLLLDKQEIGGKLKNPILLKL